MKPLLRAKDVAAILGISRAAAYRQMKLMAHVVVGDRTIRITEAALESYLRRRTEDPWNRRSGSTKRRTTPSGTAGTSTPAAASATSAPRQPIVGLQPSPSNKRSERPTLR